MGLEVTENAMMVDEVCRSVYCVRQKGHRGRRGEVREEDGIERGRHGARWDVCGREESEG